MTKHYPRYTTERVQEALADTPVVFIMGARQSGKTTLAKSCLNKDWKYVNLDDQTLLNLAKKDPIGFIRSHAHQPLAIDEIQRLPELLLAIKQSVDENRTPGRFLLTGSANALLFPQVADSLAGRIEVIQLHTLSECEIYQRQPSFLKKLLNGEEPLSAETRVRDLLIQRVVTGCYPEPLQRQKEHRVSAWHRQYLEALIQKDILDLTHIKNHHELLTLLILTANYSGQLINLTELSNKLNLSRETIANYTGLLEQLFLIHQLPAWHSNHSKRLIKTPKIHFSDTGLMCGIRDITTDILHKKPDLFGHILETFVINELKKQAAWLNKTIRFYHYRDKDQVEVDCLIENAAGECFAVEVKAGATINNKSFAGLVRVKKILGDQFKMGILLYDGDHSSCFDENIFAIPISALWN